MTLVEQVARLIDPTAFQLGLDPEEKADYLFWEVRRNSALRNARAVIPVVREDCAKVAEAEKVNAAETDDESDRAYNRACDDIAAALRDYHSF